MNLFRLQVLSCAAFFTLLVTHTAQAGVITFGSGGNTFGIDFVEIGSSGNADDTTGNPSLAGKVDYIYQVGKHEVSEGMINNYNAEFGIANSLEITTAALGDDKPATFVSWNESARFVNWLNTSQGFQAAYNFTTGGVNDNIALWDSPDAWQLGGENRYRHKDAHYWLPSMDEWYKAAFFDPNSGTYFDYPTSDGSVPTPVPFGTGDKTAVYDGQSGPANINQAGGSSPFGIMGMGGNVFEWQESAFGRANISGAYNRGVRGGNWFNPPYILKSDFNSGNVPTSSISDTGFRVAGLSSPATVPEPGSLAVWSMMGVAGLWYRRRRLRNGLGSTGNGTFAPAS